MTQIRLEMLPILIALILVAVSVAAYAKGEFRFQMMEMGAVQTHVRVSGAPAIYEVLIPGHEGIYQAPNLDPLSYQAPALTCARDGKLVDCAEAFPGCVVVAEKYVFCDADWEPSE